MLSVSTPGSVGLYVLFLEWKVYTMGQSEGFTKPKVTLTISSHLNLLMLVDHKVKKGITIITEVFDYHEEILVLLSLNRKICLKLQGFTGDACW